jgi:hypothetical protein
LICILINVCPFYFEETREIENKNTVPKRIAETKGDVDVLTKECGKL